MANDAEFAALNARWCEAVREPPEVKAQFKRVVAARRVYRDEIAGLPAATIPGARAKLEAAMSFWDGYVPTEAVVAASAMADLLRLLPSGAQA